MKTVMEMFLEMFDNLTEVTYNPQWSIGGYYMPEAVKGKHAPKLQPGAVVSAIDYKGRKIVLVGTDFGNWVVFQRHYADDQGGILVYNAPAGMAALLNINVGIVDAHAFTTIFGSMPDLPNIGWRAGAFYRGLKR